MSSAIHADLAGERFDAASAHLKAEPPEAFEGTPRACERLHGKGLTPPWDWRDAGVAQPADGVGMLIRWVARRATRHARRYRAHGHRARLTRGLDPEVESLPTSSEAVTQSIDRSRPGACRLKADPA